MSDRRRHVRRLLSLVALLWALDASALDPTKRFHHYDLARWDTAEGQPLATITALAQDPQGYLWLGTQNGLVRFDGARFTVFRREQHPDLAGNVIQALSVDRDGRLWIATSTGLSTLLRGAFATVAAGDPLAAAANAVVAESGGQALVGTTAGLMRSDGTRLSPLIDSELGRRAVKSLLREPSRVWAGVGDGFIEWRGDEATLHELPRRRAGNLQVTSFARHHAALWIGTNQGLWRFHDGVLTHDRELGARPIEALLEDQQRNLWVATNSGLYRLREGVVAERITDETVLNNQWNRALFEDRAGHLWIGAQAGGLVRVRDGRVALIGALDGLTPPSITWAVTPARAGGAWIGTADGVSRLHEGRVTRVAPGAALRGRVVPALLEDSKGRLWIGSTQGLDVWSDGRALNLPGLRALPGGRYLALLEDQAGAIWIGAQHGVYRYTDAGGFQLQDDLRDSRVRYLAEIDGVLWAATELGVHRRVDGRFVAVDGDLGTAAHLALVVRGGQEGRVWLGYLDQGLVRVTGDTLTRYTAEQGLPANTILLPVETPDGWLWLSTLQGVVRLRVDDLERLDRGELLRVATEPVIVPGDPRATGVPALLCCHGGSTGAGMVSADGKLLLPNVDGVVVVDLHARSTDAPPPQPILERLVTNQAIRHDFTAALELAAAERDLSFEFTALDLGDPEALRFEYQLEGYDADWLDAGERRIAIYTNLDPGSYRLQLRTRDALGRRSPVTSLDLSIAPLPIETGWFRALLALAVVLLGYGAHRLVSWRLYHQRQALESTVARRTVELSALNERLAEANRRLEDMTLTDELTGVRNRRFIDFQISKEIAQLERLNERSEHKQALMFLMVDIDHFKRINDTYGHLVGDAVLREMARLLVRCSRTGDHVVRMGGEEFMMVMHGVERVTAIQVARRLRQVIREHAFPIGEGKTVRVTASLGFAFYPFVLDQPELLSVEDALTLADRALYYVKQNGRDSWAGVFSLPKMSEATLRDSLNQDPAVLAERGLIELVTPLRGDT
jgi:diguanylate cyclase (GGDEF)-like protein